MAQLSNSQTEKTLTHIYVREAQKSFVRPCWSAGTEVYCGMCMRGIVQPVVGAVCPICSSTVERILEVTPGGNPSLHENGRIVRSVRNTRTHIVQQYYSIFLIREKPERNRDRTSCERAGGRVRCPRALPHVAIPA